MTKLRYVGTYAQEFPGPNDTVTMYGPGEFLENADTENEIIKAAMESGELIATEGAAVEVPGIAPPENNEPDKVENETPSTAKTTTTATTDTGTGKGVN